METTPNTFPSHQLNNGIPVSYDKHSLRHRETTRDDAGLIYNITRGARTTIALEAVDGSRHTKIDM